MNDDQMDEMLIQEMRDYNAPRDVPRDEMWHRIAAARAERRQAAVPIGRTPVGRTSAATRWAGVGIAAALILSAGILVGRSIERSGVKSQQTVAANAPVVPPVNPASNPGPAVVASKPGTDDSLVSKKNLINQIHEETNKTSARVRELASAPVESRRNTGSNENLAYRLVVLQHLAGSEAMITAFRSGARNGEIDAQIASWSKDLLSTTRLLESSQASSDPVMKRLLGDLDLVISQIVQYTTQGVTNNDELGLIEQTIDKRGVMQQLRSSNSVRNRAAGL